MDVLEALRSELLYLIERRAHDAVQRRIGATPRRRFQWLKDVASRSITSPEEIEQAFGELIAFATVGGYDAGRLAGIVSEFPFRPQQVRLVQKLQRRITHALETLRTAGEIDFAMTYPTRWIWRPAISFPERRSGKRLTRRQLRKMRYQSFVQGGTHSVDQSVAVALLDTLRQLDADLGKCMTPECGAPFIRPRMDTLYCQRCRKERQAQWDRDNPERARTRKRKHYQNHLGRALGPRGRKRLS